jgi:hypothetical protein
MSHALEPQWDFSHLRGHFMYEGSYQLFEFALFTDLCFACVLYHNLIHYPGIKTKLLT